MPQKNCTLIQALIMGSGFPLNTTEWFTQLLISSLVFIAAVTGVLAVPLKALWECIYRAAILRADPILGPVRPRVVVCVSE